MATADPTEERLLAEGRTEEAIAHMMGRTQAPAASACEALGVKDPRYTPHWATLMKPSTAEIIEALNKISDADNAWDTATDEDWVDQARTHEHIATSVRDFVDTNGNVIAWNDQANRWEHGGTLAEWLEGRS